MGIKYFNPDTGLWEAQALPYEKKQELRSQLARAQMDLTTAKTMVGLPIDLPPVRRYDPSNPRDRREAEFEWDERYRQEKRARAASLNSARLEIGRIKRELGEPDDDEPLFPYVSLDGY